MATGRIPINASAAIQSTIVDAKGDLIVASGADAVARLAVGTNGHILTAKSSEATGLAWEAPPAGGANFTLLNTGGTALTGAATITISGISGADKIALFFRGASMASASAFLDVTLNSETANRAQFGSSIVPTATYSFLNFSIVGSDDTFRIARIGNDQSSDTDGFFIIQGCNSAGVKIFHAASGARPIDATQNGQLITSAGTWTNSAAVTSISVTSTSGNFDAGTLFVYTSA
jgi:hypothetical protein